VRAVKLGLSASTVPEPTAIVSCCARNWWINARVSAEVIH
jgi:hypothetical protein